MTFFKPLFAPLIVHDPFHHPLLEDPWTTRYNHSVQRGEGDVHRRSRHHQHHASHQDATKGSTMEGGGGAQQQAQPHPLDWPSTPQDLFTHPAFRSPFTFPTFEQFFAPFQTIQQAQPHTQGQGQIQSQAQGQSQGQGQGQPNLAPSSGNTAENVVTTTSPLGGGGILSHPFSPSAFPSALTSTTPWPRLDVHESPEKFTLTAELGGVPKDKVQVHVDELRGVLEVRGEVYRSTGSEGEGETHADKDGAKKASGGGEEGKKEGDKSSKKKTSSSSSSRPVYTERVYGSFSRSLRLPSSVDLRAIKADFDQEGILKVDLPKKKTGEEGREGVREIQIGKET